MADIPEDDHEARLELRLTWELAESEPVMFADQMLLQTQGDYVVLTLGLAVAPALSGKDDPRFEEVSNRGTVSVKVLARAALTVKTAAKFAEAFRVHTERVARASDEE